MTQSPPEPPIRDANLDDLERRSLLQALSERDKDQLRLFRLQPRIRDFVQKQADLTPAHARAIDYFWSHHQTKFAPEGTQDAVSHYEETFYHECQLGRYQQAFATVDTCDEFLWRRRYYQTLVALYSQLHTDWQPTPDQRQDYAVVCNNLGSAYQSLGQYQQAIDFHQQSLAITLKIGDSPEERLRQRGGEANSLIGLGNAYRSLGKYQRAIDFYQQSLAIERHIGDSPEERLRQRGGEANSLIGLGNAYRSLGKYQRAIDFYQQSLEIKRHIGDSPEERLRQRGGEANSLIGLGNAYQSLGQSQQAIDFYQQSFAIQQEIGDRNGEALSLWNLGHSYQQQGKIRKGREHRIAALRIWRSLNLPVDAAPIPEISKRMFRSCEDQDNSWAESMIQSYEQLGWLMDISAGITFLISLPVRLVQRFKKSFVFWLGIGVAIVLLIWWLRR